MIPLYKDKIAPYLLTEYEINCSQSLTLSLDVHPWSLRVDFNRNDYWGINVTHGIKVWNLLNSEIGNMLCKTYNGISMSKSVILNVTNAYRLTGNN